MNLSHRDKSNKSYYVNSTVFSNLLSTRKTCLLLQKCNSEILETDTPSVFFFSVIVLLFFTDLHKDGIPLKLHHFFLQNRLGRAILYK